MAIPTLPELISVDLPTQTDLYSTFIAGAQARATSTGWVIDVSQYSAYQIQATALSGMGAGIAQDAYILFNNVYPQYSNAQGINLGLANAGIPGIYPATSAILTLDGDIVTASQTFNIPVKTILTADNGATYSVVGNNASSLEFVTITTDNPEFFVSSIATGQNTGQAVSAVLTFSPPIISVDGTTSLESATVTAVIDGVDQETLANATNRLIEIKQTPLCSDRATDFKYLAIDPIGNSVTDAIVLINNQLAYSDTQLNVGIFDVVGTPITNEILNQGLLLGTTEVVFSRTATDTQIDNTQAVMNQQDIIGAFPNVGTVSTQEITDIISSDPNPFFQVTVTLQPGYSLATEVNLEDGLFTVEQLIQREVRRGICGQPYGATLSKDITTNTYTDSILTISSIEQQLDTTLGTSTTVGTIGTFLVDRTILCWNGSAYVYQSSITLDLGIPVASTDKLPWIYDVSTTVGSIYFNILVVTS